MSVVENAIYGPVPSWRFGRSLGIDPTLPPKKCTMGCVYCQVGLTHDYFDYTRIENIRDKLLTPAELRDSLVEYIKDLDLSLIDIVTFSGSGEPTLNKKLGEMIEIIRLILPDKPVGILSNGSLIEHSEVQNIYRKLDMVTLKLDVANQDLFYRINHPMKSIPSITKQIEYYKTFNDSYGGFFGIEVMALNYKGIDNISGTYGRELIDALTYISPDVVQIEIPYRPTAKSDVSPPKDIIIKKFAQRLESILGKCRVWVYGERNASKESKIWTVNNIPHRIETILTHRPCSLQDLCIVFGREEQELSHFIRELIIQGKVETVIHQNKTYFTHTSSRTN